jgi:hypothetical protein
MFQRLILMAGFVTCVHCTKAQTPTPFYPSSNEIGINVSAMLSNFLSLNPSSSSAPPFGVHYARHFKNYSLRVGLNGSYDQASEFVDVNGLAVSRELTDHVSGLRISGEKHLRLSDKFQMNYGLDVLTRNVYTQSIIQGSFLKTENVLSLGGGPAIRVCYKISPRIQLMTEATMYGTYGFVTQRIQENGPVEQKNSVRINGLLQVPIVLFVNFNF